MSDNTRRHPFHDLERFAIAHTGKWRDLRYGTGSVSDLSIYQ